MSIRIMTQVWDIDLPDSEKLIFLALADWANDEGVCWPSIATLCKKSGKSESTMFRAIKALEGKGHLTREERPGKGTVYHLHPCHDDTPITMTPLPPRQGTPVMVTPNTLPKPHNPPKPPAEPSDAEGGLDPGDQFWRIPDGHSWKEAAPVMRALSGKGSGKRAARRRNGAGKPGKSFSPSAPSAHTADYYLKLAGTYRRIGRDAEARQAEEMARKMRGQGQADVYDGELPI